MYRSIVPVFLFIACMTSGQNLPSEWHLMQNPHIIKTGGLTQSGLYNHDEIKTFDLQFAQDNWWNLLIANYTTGTMLEATLTVDGVEYPQVGVGFKGQTSYMMINNSEKKSFSIKTDEFVDGQSVNGYTNFNLNNCFDDPSFMREFLYLRQIRNHIPAAKAAYVHLNINGESWGIYPNVQQLNKTYLNEWFLSNDGTNWRADAPAGGFGFPEWGDGTAALNWLGSDTADYQEYYTLKSSTVAQPWDHLVQTCDVLNNSADLVNEMPTYLDIDRTLWFLACEIAFGDDDSYVYKGKMDYYCYWEIETGRLTPLEYDGNSVLVDESANWTPFYHVSDVDFPLLNKLINIPIYRQRYLAHMRTIINELMNADDIDTTIDYYDELISAEVEADDKKLYSNNQYNNEVPELKERIADRVAVMMNNAELNTEGATINAVIAIGENGEWAAQADEQMLVNALVTSPDGLQTINLYYSTDLVGNFTTIPMLDDGNSGDGGAGDGTYGATLPGIPMSSIMKFYVEAVENNTAQTRSYSPVGAEHDVYYYQALPQWAANSAVVINETMASNANTAADEQSQYDDWIELYNNGSSAVDLTGYYLTDNTQLLDKWNLPDGTLLAANDYLIIWADEDSAQGPLHANFKLSSSGEQITLLNSEGYIADQVTFAQQQTDMGYARVPNGTGPFVIQNPTFSAYNGSVGIRELNGDAFTVEVFPNPASEMLNLKFMLDQNTNTTIAILDINGRVLSQVDASIQSGFDIVHCNIAHIEQGSYFIKTLCDGMTRIQKFAIVR